jgi:hypothetical protein
MPVVNLVTPAALRDSHTAIDAFVNELRILGWTCTVFYTVPGSGNTGLAGPTGAVYLAVHDPAMLNPAVTPKVIVTSGSMATELVRTEVANVVAAGGAAGTAAATIAIVQGVGGNDYGSMYDNVTGFQINVQQTSAQQLGTTPAGGTVSILYDATDDTSVPVYNYLTTNPAGRHLNFYSLAQLTANPAIIDNSTFMLIPNAGFYNARIAITRLVDSRLSVPANNVRAVYPEREYKNAHRRRNWGRIRVYGHLVAFTYRKAAHLTDKILRRKFSVTAGTLPPMEVAEKDQ